MDIVGIIGKAKEEIDAVMDLELSNIIGIARTQEGWRLSAELVERSSLPDTQDILGIYEVLLDEVGNMTSYDRKRIRRRQDLEQELEI